MRLPNSAVHVALDALASGGPDRQLGLSTTPITVTPGGLTGITEPTAGTYERVDVPASQWDPASDRAVQTDVVVPSPSEDMGVITHYFLTDGAGVPELPFRLGGDGGANFQAGSSALTLTPRIPAPL